MSVLIIDYGMSNLGSIRRSIEECGVEAHVSDAPCHVELATHIILPGVGAFADGMSGLHKRGLISAIQRAVREDEIPLLGICLGMQLLATRGCEGGASAGLGLIPGKIKRLVPVAASTKIPHVGWNEVHKSTKNGLFDNIPDGMDFYFVHSYHFIPEYSGHILARTPYCDSFVSAVVSGNVYGVQFHPEKSGRPGLQLLKNFLTL